MRNGEDFIIKAAFVLVVLFQLAIWTGVAFVVYKVLSHFGIL